MSEAERLAEHINSGLGHLKSGTLRFWGEWFGRPYDNIHQVVSCEAEQNLLRLHFNEGEVLCVWSPKEATVGGQTFKIMDADRVRWEWFSYGRPKVATNRYFMDFIKTENGVNASTDVDWYDPNLKPSRQQPAIEIL